MLLVEVGNTGLGWCWVEKAVDWQSILGDIQEAVVYMQSKYCTALNKKGDPKGLIWWTIVDHGGRQTWRNGGKNDDVNAIFAVT